VLHNPRLDGPPRNIVVGTRNSIATALPYLVVVLIGFWLAVGHS
jgi:hypothetical protein